MFVIICQLPNILVNLGGLQPTPKLGGDARHRRMDGVRGFQFDAWMRGIVALGRLSAALPSCWSG